MKIPVSTLTFVALFSLHAACRSVKIRNTADATLTVPEPLTSLLTNIKVIQEAIGNELAGSNFQGVVNELQSVAPTSTPTAIADASSRLQAAHAASPTTFYNYLANLRALGLVESVSSGLAALDGALGGENSMSNSNRDPPSSIYPSTCSSDAPYSISESALRAAIYIPSTFTYGQKPPVILFPGTASTGYIKFVGNYIPLLQGSDWADPVWVNVPGYLLGDAQVNAEYAAYAINYIARLTASNVTIVTWSQGGINTQWAFKYWPSTRQVTSDHVAISPDYAGTSIANFVSPPGIPMPPAVLQQEYLQSSDFITTLRNNGGDSADVSVTTVYSSLFDKIVEPQAGTGASAYLLDARGVGVSNNEVRVICALQPSGTFYPHEGVLFNPLGFALLQDAMTHDGPGNPSRLDLASVCSQYLIPGLDLGDLITTENAALIAGLSILDYNPKVFAMPEIMSYAANGKIPATCGTNTSQSTTTTTTTSSTGMTSSSSSTISQTSSTTTLNTPISLTSTHTTVTTKTKVLSTPVQSKASNP